VLLPSTRVSLDAYQACFGCRCWPEPYRLLLPESKPRYYIAQGLAAATATRAHRAEGPGRVRQGSHYFLTRVSIQGLPYNYPLPLPTDLC